MDDLRLAEAVKAEFDKKGGEPPAFGMSLAAAERRSRQHARRFVGLAAASVLVAAFVFMLNTGLPGSDELELQGADLMGSVSWMAPSDALLPSHEIDLYQDLPEMWTESTKPVEGALL